MNPQVFQGLQTLLESSFPKQCSNCGYVYRTAEQFFAETTGMPRGRSSLKSFVDDDGVPVVEAFRNCRCGSTLMDEFGCRRDLSETGVKRRAAFAHTLALLIEMNISEAEARAEIAHFMHGEPSRLSAWFKGQDGASNSG